jgi:hypothetical protein
MFITRFKCCLAAFALLLGISSATYAAGWFDDFNDGSVTDPGDANPLVWSQDLFGLFPGTYDASSGDYEMSNPGGTDQDIMISWVDGVSLADSYIRTQGVVLPDPLNPTTNVGGNLIPIGRMDADTISLYDMYFDVGGNLVLQVTLGGGTSTLDDPDPVNHTVVADADIIGFNASSEAIVEMDIVGDTLTGYVWRTGPRPANPQVTASGGGYLASGKAGLVFKEDDEGTKGVFRYGVAQDTPIVETFSPGDFNADGKVDAADYVTWRAGFVPFDPLNDRKRSIYTMDDYDIWRANFGTGAVVGSGSGIEASAVPEPTGLVLVLASIGACALGGRRRQ